MITRRQFVSFYGTAAIHMLAISDACAATNSDVAPHPNRRKFEPGDFLWPKKKNTYVPFSTGLAQQREQELWTLGRDAYVANAAKGGSVEERQIAERLKGMTYAQFHSLYVDDVPPEAPRLYSTDQIGVGHVGIVDLDEGGRPWIIEAMPLGDKGILVPLDGGVIHTPYQDWIKNRSGELVWHGRVRDRTSDERRRIAQAALKYVGSRYWFWNFDLADDSAFYCSKLCWLSVHKALGFSIDGNENSKRLFWFSPKKFMRAQRIQVLHSPGPY